MNDDFYLTCGLCAFLMYHLFTFPRMEYLYSESLLQLLIRNFLYSLLAALVTLLGVFLILDIEEALKNQIPGEEDNLNDDLVLYERFTVARNPNKSKASNDRTVDESIGLSRSADDSEVTGDLKAGE